jgi:hypothetical protein
MWLGGAILWGMHEAPQYRDNYQIAQQGISQTAPHIYTKPAILPPNTGRPLPQSAIQVHVDALKHRHRQCMVPQKMLHTEKSEKTPANLY